LGVSKAQKLSKSSRTSSGRLYTGIIKEKSLAIIDTNLHNANELFVLKISHKKTPPKRGF
jgi:hypothetical protein